MVPASVLATQKDRIAVEQIGRDSVAAQDRSASGAGFLAAASSFSFAAAPFQLVAEPLPDGLRKAALKQVDANLVAEGLLTPAGTVAPQAQKLFEVTLESCLPTPGIIVKGCIDTCDVCEPELQKKIELELEEQELKNQLLKRQIELLDKSQEYRCCPADAEPTP